MTSRRDTVRDTVREPRAPGPPEDSFTTDRTNPGPTEPATDPGPAPSDGQDDDAAPSSQTRNRSESEPVKIIFQKIAQRDQIVPRSVEQGERRHVVHSPAAPRAMVAEPQVLVSISTDPGAHQSDAVLAPTVILPRRPIGPAILAVALLGLVLAAAAILLSSRSAVPPSSAGASVATLPPSGRPMTPSPQPSMVATATAASATSPAAAAVATPSGSSRGSRQPRPASSAAVRRAVPTNEPAGLGAFPEDL